MNAFILKRRACCYFHFVKWSCFSLGFHVDVAVPNIELHLPFGFIRIGWEMKYFHRDTGLPVFP